MDRAAPSCLKVMGCGVVDGPCDFSASQSPFGLDFGTLDSDFGLGLDNSYSVEKITLQVKYKTKKDNNIVTLFVELIFAQIEELHDYFMRF